MRGARALRQRGAPLALRAKALMVLGSLTFFQGDFVRTRALVGKKAPRSAVPQEISRWWRSLLV